MDSPHSLPDFEELHAQDQGWFRSHGLIITTICAGVLLLVGGIVVGRSIKSPQLRDVQSWGGSGDSFQYQPSAQDRNEPTPQFSANTPLGATDNSISIPLPTNPARSNAMDTASDPFDFNAFISRLSKPSKSSSGDTSFESSLAEAFAFIPNAFSAPTHKELTPSQEALRKFGNEVGLEIQQFENSHSMMTQVLKDQIEDPANAEKIAAMQALADDLVALGKSVASVTAPPEATTAAAAVAKSYQEIGGKLRLVPEARYDSDRVQAMLTYNTAADAFVKNYVALATIFSISGVKFSPQEPGSVFTFQ